MFFQSATLCRKFRRCLFLLRHFVWHQPCTAIMHWSKKCCNSGNFVSAAKKLELESHRCMSFDNMDIDGFQGASPSVDTIILYINDLTNGSLSIAAKLSRPALTSFHVLAFIIQPHASIIDVRIFSHCSITLLNGITLSFFLGAHPIAASCKVGINPTASSNTVSSVLPSTNSSKHSFAFLQAATASFKSEISFGFINFIQIFST